MRITKGTPPSESRSFKSSAEAFTILSNLKKLWCNCCCLCRPRVAASASTQSHSFQRKQFDLLKRRGAPGKRSVNTLSMVVSCIIATLLFSATPLNNDINQRELFDGEKFAHQNAHFGRTAAACKTGRSIFSQRRVLHSSHKNALTSRQRDNPMGGAQLLVAQSQGDSFQ